MKITDSTCSTGSHINKGLTEIQAALGVEWNSFFWQIVCCCHGYGTCCTSGLFPTPPGTFLLLMPGFPFSLNLQVQLDVPVYGLSHSPACQQGPASQSGSPNSHSLSLLFKVMPCPFHFSICKQAKLAVQNQLWLFSILFPEQGRKLTDLALSLSSLPVFTLKFLSSIQFFLLAFPSCSVEQSVLAKRVNISNNYLYITREQQMSPDP